MREANKLGIPVVAHVPQVGRNLRDHVDFVIAYQSSHKDLIGFMPGDIVNDLTASVGDANSHIPETKVFLCNIKRKDRA